MGIIVSGPIEFFSESMKGAIDKGCQVCGEEGDAFWHDMKTIVVCRNCALKILARLIADAVFLNDTKFPTGAAKLAWERAEKEYWKGFASRLARLHQVKEDKKHGET